MLMLLMIGGCIPGISPGKYWYILMLYYIIMALKSKFSNKVICVDDLSCLHGFLFCFTATSDHGS